MSKLVSGRVKKLPQSGITSDRYEFLGLEQAEPDLGDPIVGPSSVGANPYTGDISNAYVLISDDAGGGNRYWAQQPNLIAGGIVNPGSITVRDEGVIIGSVNQITDINFIGSGVTVLSPASWVGAGSSSVDIEISVTDVAIPSGRTGSVGYRDSNSFLQGASDFIFNPVNNNVGIGSTIPTSKLDVLGNAKISGIVTVGVLSAISGNFTTSLKVGNFEISDDTTFVRVISGSIGIGTSAPISTLDVRGTVNVSGASTFGSVNSSTGVFDNLNANRISVGFITATNSYVGVLTAPVINNTTLVSTSSSITNLVGTSVTISGNLQVNGNTLFVNAGIDRVGIGTTNPLQRVQVGVATNPVVITDLGRIGIGTTNPIYGLDVRTNVGFGSFIFVGGVSGNANEVLVSGGSGLPFWGAPSNITVGAANSVAIAGTQLNSLFYPTFTRQTIDNAEIRIDTNGLSYNPALNYFGIATTALNYNLTINGSVGINTNAFFVSPTNNRVGVGTTIPVSTLDVVGDIRSSTTVSAGTTFILGSVANLSSGIVTTTTTSEVGINSINTGLFRSARYNIQVTTTGQLVGSASSSSVVSVGNLQGGTRYLSGSYTNVALATSSGGGNDARADITITPEKNLIINSISNGLFNADETSGVTVNSPISFNRAIPATPAENSRVTSINVSSIGSGYTSVPTIQIAAPTNNPAIPGVTGIGSTATAIVSSLVVTGVSIANPGIHSTIPTVSFKTPVGSGTSATGLVGVGVSSVRITSSGSGYNPLPSVSITGSATQSATVAISTVFVTNTIVRNTGLGYTSGNFPVLTISTPQVGINTATAIVNSLGISTHFTIIPGIGYTRPPILTVASPNVGVNTATVTATLGISTITVTASGAGYTSSSQIQVATSPTVTGFAASVGMGITATNATFSGGNGYNTPPTVTVSAPDVGFNTAVINFTTFTPGGPLVGPLVVQNPGSGYFSIPRVTITGGGGAGAAITITEMIVTDVTVNNTGFGFSNVATVSIVSPVGVGAGASASASMGIGAVNVVGFGSGYNNPPGIAITAFDGITGSGASVTAGLGLTSSNITITNVGSGYSSIPSVTVSSGSTVAIAASVLAGVGLTGIVVTNPGIGYSVSIPSVTFSTDTDNPGSGASAGVSSVIVSNVFITNPGTGYTASDLASLPIATFSPTGTAATVGFGVSTIAITNLGIGYTSAVAAAISFSAPNLSTGTTATASASLGYPGILPGPGVNTTGNTAIYYVASVSPTNIGISTGVGIGTLTITNVGDDLFTNNKPVAAIGGTVTNVFIVSPGSGYATTSILSASNFDGANVGSGFSFTVARTVNNYQFSDVMILQSVGSASTACDFLEYGTIANNEILGSFNADISGNNARLLFTPTYRNNTIKVSSHSITN